MKIRIITIGKIKDKELSLLIQKYLKKIKHYNQIELISLKENNLFENPNSKEIDMQLQSESLLIKKFLKNSYNISLCIEGKQQDSIELSKSIKKILNNSYIKNINFIIGSSHGLDEEIKKLSNVLLSFSSMTFTHQLMQLILLEQIFRSFKIMNNEKYHK